MNKKEIKSKVNELLASGTAKSDVFAQLSGRGIRDSRLAYLIASYVSPWLSEQYASKVNILLTLMFVQALIGFFLGYAIGAKIGPNAQWIIGSLIALIPLLFALGFYKNQVGAYNTYILLSIIQMPRQFNGFESSPVSTSIGLAIGFAILGFVWYLQQKLFPDFLFITPKKVKGRYVFSDQAHTRPHGKQTESSPATPYAASSGMPKIQPERKRLPVKTDVTRIVVYSVLALTILGGVLYKALPDTVQHSIKDQAIRPFAPNFDLVPNKIKSARQDEWIAEYRRRGYELHCYANLRPEEQISKDDDYNCWAIIKSAYDNIPAMMLVFWFSKGELQHLKVDFPDNAFASLQNYLSRHFEGVSRLDQTSSAPFGKDIYGQPLMVWPTRYGIVVTSKAATAGQALTLLWTSKEKLVRDFGDQSPIPAPANIQLEQKAEEKTAPALKAEIAEPKPAHAPANPVSALVLTEEIEQSGNSKLASQPVAHRAKKHKPVDLRHCLNLPSNYEIAKCAEI
jgi:hypothetical protein